jgi:hypothetical protein
MRKFLVLALATGALLLALGVSASSADAACSSKCLNKKIKKLQNQVATLNTTITCMQNAVPVTRYDGYDYLNTFSTTALDITDPGDPINFWMPIIQPGTCGVTTVRAAAAHVGNTPSGFTLFNGGPPQTKK